MTNNMMNVNMMNGYMMKNNGGNMMNATMRNGNMMTNNGNMMTNNNGYTTYKVYSCYEYSSP